MKTLKAWDCVIQITLITAALVINGLFYYNHNHSDFDTILLCYYGVGGWQFLSMLLHFAISSEYKIRLRKLYVIATTATILTAFILLGIQSDFLLNYMLFVLFWTPLLAILYIAICITETRKIHPTDN